MTVDEMLDQHRASGEGREIGDSEEPGGAFGMIRAPRERALMISLHKKDGAILAVPYAMIEQMRYAPSEGITFHAGTLEVRITGRHLTGNGLGLGLFSAMAHHRVVWIREQSQTSAFQTSETSTIIESITW